MSSLRTSSLSRRLLVSHTCHTPFSSTYHRTYSTTHSQPNDSEQSTSQQSTLEQGTSQDSNARQSKSKDTSSNRFIVSYSALEKQLNPPPAVTKRVRTWRPYFQKFLRYPVEIPETGEVEWKAGIQGKNLVYLPNIQMKLVRPFIRPGQKYNPYEVVFHAPLQLTKPDIISYLEAVYPKLHPTYINTINVRSKVSDRMRRGQSKKELKSQRMRKAYKKVILGLRKGQEWWWPDEPTQKFLDDEFMVGPMRQREKESREGAGLKSFHGINTDPDTSARRPVNPITQPLQMGYPTHDLHPKRRPWWQLYTYGRGPRVIDPTHHYVEELRESMEEERKEILKRASEIYTSIRGAPLFAPPKTGTAIPLSASEGISQKSLVAPSSASVPAPGKKEGEEEVQSWWQRMRTRLGASKEAEKPKEATSLPPAALAASDAEKEQEPVRVAAVPDSPPANATKGELKAWKAAKRVEEIRQAQVAQKKAEEAFESLPTEERFRKLYKEDENKAWDAIVVHVAREREREAREKAASVDPQTAWDMEEEENPFEPLRSKWVGQWSELMRETRELGDKVPERRWGDADVARLEKEEELNGKQSERRNSVE